jgi:hypothetical protein
MLTANVVTNYTYWHYRKAFNELFHVWLNFLWFVIHFFSLPALTRSLFSPWKRMTEERQGGFSFETLAAYVIVNLLSRVVGFIMRGAVILAGLVVLLATTITGAIIMVCWFIAPIIIIAMFVSGIGLVLVHTKI